MFESKKNPQYMHARPLWSRDHPGSPSSCGSRDGRSGALAMWSRRKDDVTQPVLPSGRVSGIASSFGCFVGRRLMGHKYENFLREIDDLV